MKTVMKLLSIALLLSVPATLICAPRSKQEKCCKYKKFDRAFEAKLSFAQLLTSSEGHEGETLIPRPVTDTPLGDGEGVHGKMQICFSEDLSEASYRLYVTGLTAPENKNELITQVHIHGGRASQNGPHIIDLYIGAPSDACGEQSDGLFIEGILTNEDILPHVSVDGNSYNSIASFLDGIRRGEVYVNVHGSGGCEEGKVKYGHGVIRGQLLAKETSN